MTFGIKAITYRPHNVLFTIFLSGVPIIKRHGMITLQPGVMVFDVPLDQLTSLMSLNDVTLGKTDRNL